MNFIKARNKRTGKNKLVQLLASLNVRYVFKTMQNMPFKSLVLAGGVASMSMQVQAAPIDQAAVQAYAAAMKRAANSQSVAQVAKLVSNDALISLSRKGKTTSLDKNGYLDLLQSSWNQAQNYNYDITINNVVISGDQAKADVKTVETWVKDGKNTTFVTSSRVTLTEDANNAVLLRAVSQVTIN